MRIQVRPWVSPMEEPGEQDTIVFALSVSELARECVCVFFPLASSVTIHAKTTVHYSPDFSMVSPLFSLSNLV
jgi:hypothetical protein